MVIVMAWARVALLMVIVMVRVQAWIVMVKFLFNFFIVIVILFYNYLISYSPSQFAPLSQSPPKSPSNTPPPISLPKQYA